MGDPGVLRLPRGLNGLRVAGNNVLHATGDPLHVVLN